MTLREIERRREGLAARLRKASDEVIEGECTEHLPTSGGPGDKDVT
jgi:hypothetical protein